MQNQAAIIIPARMASTRYPNKPLAHIAGMTMIERVWRLGKAAGAQYDLYIATDDEMLKHFALSFGAEVLMTSSSCVTGTDRVAEAARQLGQRHAVYFSLQGDAVLTPPWVIDAVLSAMLQDPSIPIATPAVHLEGQALLQFIAHKRTGTTSGTCVVFNRNYDALYFSKVLIPYLRSEETPIYRHIGLYAYRADTLQKLSQWQEGPLEKAEKLEQLRALENGIPIRIVPVDYKGRTHGSVDRPEDVATIEQIIEREGELI